MRCLLLAGFTATADAAQVGSAVLLYIVLIVSLGALFLGFVIVMRARRLRRAAAANAISTSKPPAAVDPWHEAARRIDSDVESD